jgi:hypothetical protein
MASATTRATTAMDIRGPKFEARVCSPLMVVRRLSRVSDRFQANPWCDNDPGSSGRVVRSARTASERTTVCQAKTYFRPNVAPTVEHPSQADTLREEAGAGERRH